MDQKETMRINLSDKLAVIQVLGCLMNNPLLLAEGDYQLKVDDFPERFHRVVFGAIEYLANQGMVQISAVDVDQFLVHYDVQYKVFTDNQGMEYITRCINLADCKKFSFYYTRLKKYSVLYRFWASGFNIDEILNVALTDPNAIAKQQAAFDAMSINDIIALFEGKVAVIAADFGGESDVIEVEMANSLRKLKESFKDTPDIGVPCLSPKCTTLFRGQRLGKLHLESSFTGGGKSRKAVGEATHLAVPQYYDTNKQQWINTGLKENVLFISIELKPEELQTMMLAFVSGVNENHIRDAAYEPGEEARVDKAIEYIERCPNFRTYYISDYDMEDIERVIRKYKQLYNTRYVFFDYLTASFKMLSTATAKTHLKNMREDQVLLSACARLKKLAQALNIHVHTSTQLNREWKNTKEVDASVLRGAQSMADKCDVGFIILPPREDDKPAIQEYMRKGFNIEPNLVLHIFKVRQARMQRLKLFIHFDYGTCRVEDCFAVDKDGIFLNIDDTTIEAVLEQTKEEKSDDNPWGDFEL